MQFINMRCYRILLRSKTNINLTQCNRYIIYTFITNKSDEVDIRLQFAITIVLTVVINIDDTIYMIILMLVFLIQNNISCLNQIIFYNIVLYILERDR
jgi:hypothetical protein